MPQVDLQKERKAISDKMAAELKVNIDKEHDILLGFAKDTLSLVHVPDANDPILLHKTATKVPQSSVRAAFENPSNCSSIDEDTLKAVSATVLMQILNAMYDLGVNEIRALEPSKLYQDSIDATMPLLIKAGKALKSSHVNIKGQAAAPAGAENKNSNAAGARQSNNAGSAVNVAASAQTNGDDKKKSALLNVPAVNDPSRPRVGAGFR